MFFPLIAIDCYYLACLIWFTFTCCPALCRRKTSTVTTNSEGRCFQPTMTCVCLAKHIMCPIVTTQPYNQGFVYRKVGYIPHISMCVFHPNLFHVNVKKKQKSCLKKLESKPTWARSLPTPTTQERKLHHKLAGTQTQDQQDCRRM